VPVHRFHQGKVLFLMATAENTPEMRQQSVRCITIHSLRNHQSDSERFSGGRRGILWLRMENRARAVLAMRVMRRYGKYSFSSCLPDEFLFL